MDDFGSNFKRLGRKRSQRSNRMGQRFAVFVGFAWRIGRAANVKGQGGEGEFEFSDAQHGGLGVIKQLRDDTLSYMFTGIPAPLPMLKVCVWRGVLFVPIHQLTRSASMQPMAQSLEVWESESVEYQTEAHFFEDQNLWG